MSAGRPEARAPAGPGGRRGLAADQRGRAAASAAGPPAAAAACGWWRPGSAAPPAAASSAAAPAAGCWPGSVRHNATHVLAPVFCSRL